MRFVERPAMTPVSAAERLVAIAKTLPVDKGRICVGHWNREFLASGGTVAEYLAGRDRLLAAGTIKMHESGGFILPSEAVLADWDGGTNQNDAA